MNVGQKIALGYIRASINLMALVSTKKAAKKAFNIFCTPMRKSSKKNPPVFKKGEVLSFHMGKTKILGRRWNPGGVKKVLILHGFESSSKNFERYIQSFIKKNYEVLAFDAPAHGDSEGKHINLPLYVDMIRAIYYKFGPVQSFMAHSFGGLALVHFIEKLSDQSAIRLVLVAPATETKTAIDSFFSFLQLDSNIRREFDALILKKSGVPPEFFSIPRALAHIQAPILWIHDTQDDITPIRDLEAIRAKQMDNIQFMITEGLGHRRIYRDDRVIRSITEFL
jgi:pimeloyl-ACP methyl ester carboxylesterase